MYLQLAEDTSPYLADQCGLPPLKPLHTNEANARRRNPERWAEYDRKRKEWEDCRAGKGKSTSLHPLRSVILAPGRALFLALLDWNVDGLASRLATENMTGLKAQWSKLGGDQRKLVEFINKGKKKQPKRVNFLDKFKGAQALAEDTPTDENPAGLTPAQKTAIIGASTTLGVTLGGVIPPIAPISIPGGSILGTVIVGIYPFIKNASLKTAAQETAGALVPDAPLPPTTPGGNEGAANFLNKKNFTGMSNAATISIVAAVTGAGATYYFYKKKRNKKAAIITGAATAATIGGILLIAKNKPE